MKTQDRDHLVPTSEGMGVIVPRPLHGLMKLDAKDVAGPVVGSGGALLGVFLARRYGNKIVRSGALANRYPEVAGAVVGSLLSVPLYYWKRDPRVVAGGIVAAVVTSAAVFGARKIMEKTAVDAAALPAATPAAGLGMLTAARATRGLVAQRAVGALPGQVQAGAAIPQPVRMGMDHTVYGKVV